MNKVIMRAFTPSIISHTMSTALGTTQYTNRARFVNDYQKPMKIVGISLASCFAGTTAINGNISASTHIQVGTIPRLGDPLAQLLLNVTYAGDVNNLVQGGVNSASGNVFVGNGHDETYVIEPYEGSLNELAEKGALYINASIIEHVLSLGTVSLVLLIRAHIHFTF